MADIPESSMTCIRGWLHEQEQAQAIHLEHPSSKPRALINTALSNIRTIRSCSPESADILDQWVRKHYYILRPVFRKRTEQGFVKNFNGYVKDTQHHLAQKSLDFLSENLEDNVYSLINEYLKSTGDYLGLSVLPFYKIMASMNRAVNALESDDLALFYYWLHVAQTAISAPRPKLYLVSGLNANHRFSASASISQQLGAIHLNTLTERYRLFGLDDASTIDFDKVFSPEANQLIANQMIFLTEKILKARFSVVLDGRFLKRTNRQSFVNLAQQYKAHYIHLASIDPSLIYQDDILKKDIDDYEIVDAEMEFEDFEDATEQQMLRLLETL